MWAARVIGMRPWVCGAFPTLMPQLPLLPCETQQLPQLPAGIAARSGIYELKEQLRCLLGRQVQGRHIIQPNLSQYRYNNLPRKHGVDGRIRNEVPSASLFLSFSLSLSASVPSLL